MVVLRLFWPERLLPVSFSLSTHTVLTTPNDSNRSTPATVWCMQDVAGSRMATPTTPFSTRLLIESPDCRCYIAYHTSFTVTGYLCMQHQAWLLQQLISLTSFPYCHCYIAYRTSFTLAHVWCMQNKERPPKQHLFGANCRHH